MATKAAKTPAVPRPRKTRPAKVAPTTARRPQADDFPELFELIISNRSLRAACKAMGLHRQSVERVIEADPVLRGQYARAREDRGDTIAEKVLTISEAAMAGQIPADVARIAIDAHKWAAGKMAPKTWGERSQIAISNPDGSPLQTGGPAVVVTIYDNGREDRPAGSGGAAAAVPANRR